jgi:hypothetical protein
MDEPREIVGVTGPGISLVWWPLVVVAVILIVGVAVSLCKGRVTISVPQKDLAAYHRVMSTDLDEKRVWRRGLDEDVLRTRAQIKGRVTRTALGKDDQIHDDSLTTPVGPKALGGFQIKLHPEGASSLGVSPGNKVKLHFAPTTETAIPKATSIDALLLDATETDDKQEFVVVVDSKDIPRLLSVLGRSELVITPAEQPRGEQAFSKR